MTAMGISSFRWEFVLRRTFLDHSVGGFEQEAWLVDENYYPAPLNEKFMALADKDYICAELAQFNIELNVEPLELNGKCLRLLQKELETNWQFCEKIADDLILKRNFDNYHLECSVKSY